MTYFYMGDAAYRRSGVPGPHTIIQWAPPRQFHFTSEFGDAPARWDQLDPDRLKVVGYGQHRPVSSNDTAEDHERNRRIEIKVLAAETTVVSVNQEQDTILMFLAVPVSNDSHGAWGKSRVNC
jgi:hypothetical protein